MSWVSILLALVTVIGLSVGQILFKIAAVGMTGSAPLWLLALRNGYLWSALLVYGAATVLWIALLRQAPLRLAYPFIGLAFLIVPILAHNFFKRAFALAKYSRGRVYSIWHLDFSGSKLDYACYLRS